MKLSMPSLGKSKKQGSRTLDTNGEAVLVAPKVATVDPLTEPKPVRAGKGFMAKITSRASLKSKKSRSGRIENGAAVPAALQVSKSEKELRSAFRVYDADNDGRISHAELSKVLTSLGGEISEEEVRQLMKQIDTDDDGFISLEEFIHFHQGSAVPVSVGGDISPMHDPMRDAFQMFDKDGNGLISVTELQSVLVSLGDKGHSLEECKKMISSVDKDGDGFVDFTEFQVLMGGQE